MNSGFTARRLDTLRESAAVSAEVTILDSATTLTIEDETHVRWATRSVTGTAHLQPGDLLVVDHLKPHQIVEGSGLDTRAVVITFMPECVFAPGAPPADCAFLLPFFRKVEGRPQVLRAHSPRANEAHDAIGQLLDWYFAKPGFDREAGCKAWLLVLLHVLIREFRGSVLERVELLQRQEQAARLSSACCS